MEKMSNKKISPRKKRAEIFLIVIGCCCLLAAASLSVYNCYDDSRAASASDNLTQRLTGLIETGVLTHNEEVSIPNEKAIKLSESVESEAKDDGMKAVYVSGYKICGTIAIPDIGVDLAIIGNWSYPNLRIAPCRYSGTPDGQMILLAHNYDRHFGRIDELEPGDTVTFTDIDGVVYKYAVTGTEIWATDQLREIISGDDWDLTLFTCTYGGSNRVVVRCERVAE